MNLKEWGNAVKSRDNNTCQLCDGRYEPDWLMAHHVVPVRIGGQNTLENGETLCPPCHKKIHSLIKVNHIPRNENIYVPLDASKLGRREREYLGFIAQGYTVTEVANVLGLSPKTISTYRIRCLRKLRLRNNAELIRYALENKITLTGCA